MNNFGYIILSWLTGQELPQEEFDKDFIDYFKSNPNGYDEVIKTVKEQVPERLRQRFIDMFSRLNDIAKKGENDGQ